MDGDPREGLEFEDFAPLNIFFVWLHISMDKSALLEMEDASVELSLFIL